LYFNRKEERFITFDPTTFQSINASETIDAQGVEVEVDWNILDDLKLITNYTFTERKGDTAIRIPKHKVNTSLAYDFLDRFNASLAYSLTGDRTDTKFNPDFSQETVLLESFSLVDFYLGYTVIPNKMKVFLNANNLFNQEYTEVRIGFNLSL